MDSPWTENHGGGGGCRERAIEELIKGKDSLILLKNFLQHRLGTDGSDSDSTKELVAGISRSFTSVISMLNPDAKESDQISDTTLDRKSMISDVTSKPPPTVKDRRGCYKRRKSEESWQKISSTMEDGYAWRKYGQKEILNSNFPRCYFRCTHKYDQGCKALKQIQMMHDEPVRYKIIYIGRHSCTTTTTTSPSFDQGLFACDVGPGESNCQFVSFETYKGTPTSKLQQAHANYNLPVKEEVKEETMISDLCQDPVDSVAWNDFPQIESSSALFRNYKTDGFGYFDQNQNVFNGFTNCSFSDFNDNFEFEEITNNYSL